MTDREEYLQWCVDYESDFDKKPTPYAAWQAAKESERQRIAEFDSLAARFIKAQIDLGAANQRIVEFENGLNVAREMKAQSDMELVDARRELEAAKQERDGWIDSAKHFANGQTYYQNLIDQAAKSIGLPMYTADDAGVHQEPLRAKLPECVAALQAEKEALEKKLAEQQAKVTDAYIVLNGCEETYDPTHSASYALRILESNPAEELTKREAAARQQGFEEGFVLSNESLQRSSFAEGNQACRDEVLKELSEQEPLFYYRDGEDKAYRGVHMQGFTIALIPRPLPPTIEEPKP